MSHVQFYTRQPVRNFLMWTPDLVQARFIEAANTELRQKGVGPSSGAAWPGYPHDWEDKAGWGTERLREDREEFWHVGQSPREMSRYEEVIGWSLDYLRDRHERELVWGWSRAQISNFSFARLCRNRGLRRMTALVRVEKLFRQISDGLNRLWDIPAKVHRGECTPPRQNGTKSLQSEFSREDEFSPRSPHSERYAPRSMDLLTTPEDLKAFARHLKLVNKVRRRAQERRRAVK